MWPGNLLVKDTPLQSNYSDLAFIRFDFVSNIHVWAAEGRYFVSNSHD